MIGTICLWSKRLGYWGIFALGIFSILGFSSALKNNVPWHGGGVSFQPAKNLERGLKSPIPIIGEGAHFLPGGGRWVKVNQGLINRAPHINKQEARELARKARITEDNIQFLIGESPLIELGHLTRGFSDIHLFFKRAEGKYGSYQARELAKELMSMPQHRLRAGIVLPTEGSTGVQLARLAKRLREWTPKQRDVGPTHIFVPNTVKGNRIADMEAHGAYIHRYGDNFEEASIAAEEFALARGMGYMHPFNANMSRVGRGSTVGEEVIDQLWRVKGIDEPATFLVPMAGGSAVAGFAPLIKNMNADSKVYAIRTADFASVEAALLNRKVQTPSFKSESTMQSSLKPSNLHYIDDYVDGVFYTTPEQTQQGANFLKSIGADADGSAAGPAAAVLLGIIPDLKGTVVILNSGKRLDLLLHKQQMAREAAQQAQAAQAVAASGAVKTTPSPVVNTAPVAPPAAPAGPTAANVPLVKNIDPVTQPAIPAAQPAAHRHAQPFAPGEVGNFGF